MSVSAEGLIWLVWRLRCGNDAPWKSGKSQKSDFPPIPTTLGNPHKTRVSTFPPATAAEGTMKANTAEPLESRGCSDSCTEPNNLDPSGKQFLRFWMGASSTNQPSDLIILHREFTGDLSTNEPGCTDDQNGHNWPPR